MKAIIRPSHNYGKSHVYTTKNVENSLYSKWSSLCGTVVPRILLTKTESGNYRPIECERCKRLVEKNNITF